jgi:hypothetical protein
MVYGGPSHDLYTVNIGGYGPNKLFRKSRTTCAKVREKVVAIQAVFCFKETDGERHERAIV